MWACIRGGSDAGVFQNRGNHAGGAAFALGTGDVDSSTPVLRVAEPVQKSAHGVYAHSQAARAMTVSFRVWKGLDVLHSF